MTIPLIPLASESTAPCTPETIATLAARAFHDAAQVLRTDPADWSDLAQGAASDLLAEGTHQFSQLYLLFIRQERLIEEQRAENVTLSLDNERLTRAINHLERTDTENKQRLIAAEREKEEIVRDLAALVDKSTDAFNRMRKLEFFRRQPAQPLNGEYPRPMGATRVITESPRAARSTL